MSVRKDRLMWMKDGVESNEWNRLRIQTQQQENVVVCIWTEEKVNPTKPPRVVERNKYKWDSSSILEYRRVDERNAVEIIITFRATREEIPNSLYVGTIRIVICKVQVSKLRPQGAASTTSRLVFVGISWGFSTEPFWRRYLWSSYNVKGESNDVDYELGSVGECCILKWSVCTCVRRSSDRCCDQMVSALSGPARAE